MRQLYRLDAAGCLVPEPCEDRWCQWFASPEGRTVAHVVMQGASVVTTCLGLDGRTLLPDADQSRPLYFVSLAYSHMGEILGCAYAETKLAALAEHEALIDLIRGLT